MTQTNQQPTTPSPTPHGQRSHNQAMNEKRPIYRGSEKRLGCHTTGRNRDMNRKRKKTVKSPRHDLHTRPMRGCFKVRVTKRKVKRFHKL